MSAAAARVRAGALVWVAAALPRALVAQWGSTAVPPHADGTFYHTLATRLAEGAGYTWLWPDGAVTPTAHYPVGYPALVSLAYALVGASPGVAMWLAAMVQSLAALALFVALDAELGRRAGLVGGLLFALHPGLIAYTPALMTEGVTASLLAFALAATTLARTRRGTGARLGALAVVGVVLGVATLVRPQVLPFAPLLGALAASSGARTSRARGAARALARAALVTVACAVVVAPWTYRNCATMGRCALVSVNGGWNLAIGADRRARGTWAELVVPPACREVFDEAEKDACFAREARRVIAAEPAAWLALAPAKLAATFDYCGAGPWYLHAAAPGAFGERAKVVVGALTLCFDRALLGLGLAALALRVVGERRGRRALVGLAGLLAALPGAWLPTLGLALGAALRAATRYSEPARGGRFVLAASALLLLGTAAVHVVFFGAGRYALPVAPAFVALAALAFAGRGGRASSGSGAPGATPAFDMVAEARHPTDPAAPAEPGRAPQPRGTT